MNRYFNKQYEQEMKQIIASIPADTIAATTDEPQDARHYLIGVDDLTGAQPDKLLRFINSDKRMMYLGGTTYQYSVWAIRTDNGIEIWRIPFDYQGRWMNARKRSWNNDR